MRITDQLLWAVARDSEAAASSMTLTIYGDKGTASIRLDSEMAKQLAMSINPSGQLPSKPQQPAPEMALDDL